MICTFAGHRKHCEQGVFDKVINAIKNLVENEGVTVFYLGGYGQFDEICKYAVKQIKNSFPEIESCLVLPYLNTNRFTLEDYDYTIFPPIEKVPKRFAIPARNKWMVRQSDFVVAYLEFSRGGAYETVEYAKRKNKTIINI